LVILVLRLAKPQLPHRVTPTLVTPVTILFYFVAEHLGETVTSYTVHAGVIIPAPLPYSSYTYDT